MPMLKRVNLCVADMETALRLYRDALGFTVSELKDSLPTSYSYPVFAFPRDAKIRFATLDAPGQPRTLALTELRGAPLPRPPVPHTSAVVLNVIDFDEVLARVAGLGLKVVPEQPLPGPDGSPKGREAAFVDADGHLIVIYKLNDQ